MSDVIAADARPSHDSAMVHTSSSASMRMSMSTGSMPGGRRSSSTFERKPAHPVGRHSSVDAGRHSSGAFGASARSSSAPTGRGSTESTHSEQTSGRSSFAMEQDPAGGRGSGSVDSAMRPSVESFGFGSTASTRAQSGPSPMSSEQLQALCAQMRVPPAMQARFLRLAVLHPSLPVPMQALVGCCPAAVADSIHMNRLADEGRHILSTFLVTCLMVYLIASVCSATSGACQIWLMQRRRQRCSRSAASCVWHALLTVLPGRWCSLTNLRVFRHVTF